MQEVSKNLNNSLRSINNSIRKYLNDLLDDETLMPDEIIKLIDYYLYENMGRMLENYIDVKFNGDKSGKKTRAGSFRLIIIRNDKRQGTEVQAPVFVKGY